MTCSTCRRHGRCHAPDACRIAEPSRPGIPLLATYFALLAVLTLTAAVFISIS